LIVCFIRWLIDCVVDCSPDWLRCTSLRSWVTWRSLRHCLTTRRRPWKRGHPGTRLHCTWLPERAKLTSSASCYVTELTWTPRRR